MGLLGFTRLKVGSVSIYYNNLPTPPQAPVSQSNLLRMAYGFGCRMCGICRFGQTFQGLGLRV